MIEKSNNYSRDSVYDLWYQVYFMEMGRNAHYANHKRKQITDALEPHSYIFTAEIYNTVIGSLRVNFPEDGNISYYKDLYELDTLQVKSVGIGTRYMVDKAYRGLYISYHLIDQAIRFLSKMNKKMLIIDCSPPVYGHFEKLGFTDLLGERKSAEYGRVRIMKYDIVQKQKKPHLYIVGE